MTKYHTFTLFTILLISSAKLLIHPTDISQIPNLRGGSDADRVYSLPNAPQLTTATFSGYLAVGDTGKALHYYFTESQNDPYNDPLVIWTNGGPGCSSMLALLQEHGPFYMEDFGDTFYNNPFSWNLEANVLYVEQPAGVGYSTVSDPKQLETNDEQSSQDFLDAVLSFYQKFSPYKSNDLWVTGESYGGIYVPWLAKRILDHNALPATTDKINLKGIVVANGVANYTYDTNMAYINMSYYHSMYSPEIRKVFDDNNCKLYGGFIPDPSQSPDCDKFQQRFDGLVARVNIYDIYRKCYVPPAEEFLKEHTVYVDGYEKTYTTGMTALDYTPWKFFGADIPKASELRQKLKDNVQMYGDAPPCVYDGGVSHFLNDQTVRTALHIPASAPAWEMCANPNTFHYSIAANGSYWIYPELKAAGLDILFFSGDTDGAVPTLGTQMWIKGLGWEVIQDWTPWKVDGTVAGYKVVYDGMTFTTIHGVGHMAAQWARKQVLTMLNNFIKTGSF